MDLGIIGFVLIALAVGFVIFGILRRIEWLVGMLVYRFRRKRFYSRVKRGESPPASLLPVDYSNGGYRIEPADLIHTAEFKKQLEAVERLSKELGLRSGLPGFD